jgi:ABC-type glycerol-3-phosphate transport system permease component
VAAGAAVFLIPFAWMVSTAIRPEGMADVTSLNLIPSRVDLTNFARALLQPQFPFPRFFLNTVIVTGAVLTGQVFSAAAVAFGFAMLRFRGRNLLFLVLLSTMMIPFQVTMIPSFFIFRQLGWIDTWLPLIVPAFLGGGAFNIFLLRQFFMTIPPELIDAAKIDGCGYPMIFFRIVLPMSKPALGAVALFTFMGSWNDYLGPLIYLSSVEKYTLSLGLQLFQTSSEMIDVTLLMAASVVVLIPCLAIYFLGQKFFVQGVVFTGIK